MSEALSIKFSGDERRPRLPDPSDPKHPIFLQELRRSQEILKEEDIIARWAGSRGKSLKELSDLNAKKISEGTTIWGDKRSEEELRNLVVTLLEERRIASSESSATAGAINNNKFVTYRDADGDEVIRLTNGDILKKTGRTAAIAGQLNPPHVFVYKSKSTIRGARKAEVIFSLISSQMLAKDPGHTLDGKTYGIISAATLERENITVGPK